MKNTWIWCAINTICILLLLITFGVNFSINNKYQKQIEDNTKQIENIEYKIEKNDSIIIINNIYYEQFKK